MKLRRRTRRLVNPRHSYRPNYPIYTRASISRFFFLSGAGGPAPERRGAGEIAAGNSLRLLVALVALTLL